MGKTSAVSENNYLCFPIIAMPDGSQVCWKPSKLIFRRRNEARLSFSRKYPAVNF